MNSESLKVSLKFEKQREKRQSFSIWPKIRYFVYKIFDSEYRRQTAVIVAEPKLLKIWLPIVFNIKNRWNFRIIGYVSAQKHGKKYNYLGSQAEFSKIISENIVDNVIFLYRGRDWGNHIDLIQSANIQGKASYLYDCDKMDAWSAYGTPITQGEEKVKELSDFIFALILLILFSPLIIVVSIILKLFSQGTVIYRQKRVGKNGRIFTFYKFRSMVDGADSLKEKLIIRNEMSGPVFKIKNDPRITSLGRFLRQTSIDELPQLFNVLKGEMSLVGPRPPIIEEAEKYEPWQRKRLSVKPGMTCIWQVSGRSNIRSFDEWVNLDIKYINNYSFLLDLSIIIKTIPAVISRRGAI